MPELQPITREETLLAGGDLTPITRKEMFIKRIYDKTQTIPEPITREEYFLKKAGEGSGGDVTIEHLNVTRNGTYSESGKAYSPVIVNIPTPDNAYLLEDAEGLPSDIASFEASNLPMPKLKISIEPTQEGSGDPSPENIRPISGWDEANVVVSPTTDAEDGTTYTIQFKDGDNPLTIYGGTLDVISGELVVDRAMVDIDGSENGWSTDQVGTQSRRRFTCTGLPSLGTSEDTTFDAISNMFVNTKSSDYINMDNVFILRYLSQYRTNRIDIMTETYQNLTAFKSFLSNSNLTVVYELATPITYQLTPTQVKSLLGSNNLWSDTGKILEAEYFTKGA